MAKKKLSTLEALLKKMALLCVAKFATKVQHTALSNRVTQLEADDGSFLLSVDFSTGMLVQTGSVNGTFGVDYTTGYLTFTPASEEE